GGIKLHQFLLLNLGGCNILIKTVLINQLLHYVAVLYILIIFIFADHAHLHRLILAFNNKCTRFVPYLNAMFYYDPFKYGFLNPFVARLYFNLLPGLKIAGAANGERLLACLPVNYDEGGRGDAVNLLVHRYGQHLVGAAQFRAIGKQGVSTYTFRRFRWYGPCIRHSCWY